MPSAYSIDLRHKAVGAYDRGERKSDVCKTFDISRNTLDLWLKRREERGNVAPVTYRRGPKPKINDLKEFEGFAKENGHLTQQEMAQKWPSRVSRVLIGQALKKIEFTRKKNIPVPREEGKRQSRVYREAQRVCPREISICG